MVNSSFKNQILFVFNIGRCSSVFCLFSSVCRHSCISFFSTLLFSILCFGQTYVSSYDIEFLPYDIFLSEMNPFQEDCLKTLQPPTLFLKKVEVQKTKAKSIYLIRLSGEIKDTESVEFSKNQITFIDKKNIEEIFSFLKDHFSFNKAMNGKVILSFLSPGDRKIQIPIVFHQKIDHFFQLNIDLSFEGQIKKAILIPNLDFDKRKNLCPKSRAWINVMQIRGFQRQVIENLNGELQGDLSGNGLKAEYVDSKTQIKSILFQAEISSSSVDLPEFTLMKASRNRNTHSSFRHLFQNRFINHQFPSFGAVSSPFFRYGYGGDLINSWKVVKADTIETFRTISIQGLVGTGIEFYGQEKWAGELSMTTNIQLISDKDINNLMGIDLRAQFFYSPQWIGKAAFFGFDSRVKYLKGSYKRSQGIDRNGNLDYGQIEFGLILGKIF